MEESDAAAVARAKAGDSDGFRLLVERHSRSVFRLAYSAQVQKRIASAMAALSEQERTAFVLRHFEGLSIEEIAGALGVGASATKHSVFRAVQKLRRALEPLVNSAT